MDDKSESSERAEDSSASSDTEDARRLSNRTARTSCSSIEQHRRTLWPSVDQTLRQRNTAAIDSRQMGQRRNVPIFSEFGRAGFVNKDNTLGTSGGGLPANSKPVSFEDSENLDSHPDCKTEGGQKGMNDGQTPCHPDRNREGNQSSSTSDVPSTSSSNSGNEMEVVESQFSAALALKRQTSFGGYSGTLSTASNEYLNVSQSGSTGIQRSEIPFTSNDTTPMDFLPSTGRVDSPINTGKRTRKTAIPVILFFPPSDSSNLGMETNSPDLEEQSNPDQMDDTEVGPLESSESEVFPDYQGTRGASANIKPRKGISQRRRKVGQCEPREMPSCSYDIHTTESQVQLESSESDVNYEQEFMKVLEETGESPDVKELKKQIKRGKYSPRRHLRSNSASQIQGESAARIRGWSVASSESSFPMSISPNKQEGTECESSSSDKDSITSTTKKHSLRIRPFDLGHASDMVQSNPDLVRKVQSNPDLVRKAEALSSSEDATPTKRLKRHPTVENLNKEPDSPVGVSGLPQESRLPETSPKRKKSRSPRHPKNRRKLRSPKN